MLTGMNERGMTLMELLLASGLALGVIFGITSVDVMRVRIQEDLLQRSGQAGAVSDRSNAALASLHIARHLEDADRVALPVPGRLQLRVPVGLTFDVPANYRWDQYSHDAFTNVLRYYSNTAGGCGSVMVLAEQIGAVTFAYADEAPAPPWDPAGADPNVVAYTVEWNNGAGRSQVFPGEVTMRSKAYTDLPTGLEWQGLDFGPPAVCP